MKKIKGLEGVVIPCNRNDHNYAMEVSRILGELVSAHNARVDAEAEIVGSTNGTNPEHPVHPWYGPCDAFDNGQCMECRKIKRLNAAKSPPERILPSGSSLADSYYKGTPWPDGGGASTMGLTIVQLATVEAICKWLSEECCLAESDGGIIKRLRADAARVCEGAIR